MPATALFLQQRSEGIRHAASFGKNALQLLLRGFDAFGHVTRKLHKLTQVSVEMRDIGRLCRAYCCKSSLPAPRGKKRAGAFHKLKQPFQGIWETKRGTGP